MEEAEAEIEIWIATVRHSGGQACRHAPKWLELAQTLHKICDQLCMWLTSSKQAFCDLVWRCASQSR